MGQTGTVKDFFISYNAHDRAWAEWIAWELEEDGFSVVIQAWDFVGNWVLKMDLAMRDTQRTIAVLSPQYIEASFTQSEWAHAFQRDPTGNKDLLIPVRVAPVKLNGIFAQIVYVDLVGRGEEEARELLLKRVRRERGKPATSPKFPGSKEPSESRAARSIPQKPVYPATVEDEEKLRRVRDIVVRWRSQYFNKLDALRRASDLARTWRDKPPARLSDDVIEVITFAATAARDLQALPLHDLEFATSYGLIVDQTVFWGQAISTALDLDIEPKTRAAMEERREDYERLGIPAPEVPRRYDFEMLARVLDAAVELYHFNIQRLPRGYLKDVGQAVSGDLHAYSGLFIARVNTDPRLARVNTDPRLHLMAVEKGIERIGSFVARELELFVWCAQRNREGSLDLVAQDAQHLYYWQMSSQSPTLQFPRQGSVLDARFLSSAPGAAVATFNREGAVTVITADGGRETVRVAKPLKGADWEDARIWVDPLDEKAWYVIARTNDHDVTSGLHGSFSTQKSSKDLWGEPTFRALLYAPSSWTSFGSMTIATLDGLPCLVVERQAGRGVGVWFLDPKTLVPIRRPLAIGEFVGDVAIASGRWLVVAMLQKGEEIKNHIAVWDLDADDEDPIGGCLEERGDVYHPIVIAEKGDSFRTLQVFRIFDSAVSDAFQLVSFDWPAGKLEVLERYSNMRIWPVTDRLEK